MDADEDPEESRPPKSPPPPVECVFPKGPPPTVEEALKYVPINHPQLAGAVTAPAKPPSIKPPPLPKGPPPPVVRTVADAAPFSNFDSRRFHNLGLPTPVAAAPVSLGGNIGGDVRKRDAALSAKATHDPWAQSATDGYAGMSSGSGVPKAASSSSDPLDKAAKDSELLK